MGTNLFKSTLLGFILLIVAAGCVPSGEDSSQPTTPVTSGSSTTATASPQPGLTPGATPPVPGGSSVNCPAKPSDLEPLTRSVIDSAPFGQWFHPIFDSQTYQKSGGYDGQWSWAHTLCLGPSTGGQFRNFEKNDGRFVFRHNKESAHVEFSILTTGGKHKTVFMQGGTNYPYSVNIRTKPGVSISITGNKSGNQQVSDGGDLMTIMPDDGITSFKLDSKDSATTFEVMVWVGPADRTTGINTFDAR